MRVREGFTIGRPLTADTHLGRCVGRVARKLALTDTRSSPAIDSRALSGPCNANLISTDVLHLPGVRLPPAQFVPRINTDAHLRMPCLTQFVPRMFSSLPSVASASECVLCLPMAARVDSLEHAAKLATDRGIKLLTDLALLLSFMVGDMRSIAMGISAFCHEADMIVHRKSIVRIVQLCSSTQQRASTSIPLIRQGCINIMCPQMPDISPTTGCSSCGSLSARGCALQANVSNHENQLTEICKGFAAPALEISHDVQALLADISKCPPIKLGRSNADKILASTAVAKLKTRIVSLGLILSIADRIPDILAHVHQGT